MQKSGAARAAVVVTTRPIRAEAEAASFAVGAEAGLPLIIVKGQVECDAPLDLPLPTRAPGDNIRDSSISGIDNTVLILEMSRTSLGRRAQGSPIHPVEAGQVWPAPYLEHGAGP